MGMNGNSFNSIPSIAYIDPIRCPATAALEKLNDNSKFFPDYENENNEMDQIMDQCQRKPPQRRVRLLSEGDGDYDPYHGFIVSGIHTGKEQINHAAFDYISSSSSSSDLSDVEDDSPLSFFDNNDDGDGDGGEVLNSMISHNKNVNNNKNLKKFLLVMDKMKKSRDRGGVTIVKKQQRRLVRCIALESRLAYLDHPSDGIIWHNY
jgi:hypothetical protein